MTPTLPTNTAAGWHMADSDLCVKSQFSLSRPSSPRRLSGHRASSSWATRGQQFFAHAQRSSHTASFVVRYPASVNQTEARGYSHVCRSSYGSRPPRDSIRTYSGGGPCFKAYAVRLTMAVLVDSLARLIPWRIAAMAASGYLSSNRSACM